MIKSALLLAGLLSCVGLSAADAPKPNVLFIAIDDLRPELGCYGNPVVKTPNIDRLAARGMVFNRAYCQQAVCSPSRASIMTGRRPDATRVWDLNTHFRVALPDVKTVGQYFKEHGYFSQGMGKIFHGGFDDAPTWSTPWATPKAETYAQPENRSAGASAGEDGKNKGAAFEAGDVPDDYYTDGKTARLAVQTLAELKKKGQPFFLAVGLSKPHLPFVSPKKYWDLYNPAKIPNTASAFPVGTPHYVGDNDSGEFHTYANVPPKAKKQDFTPLPDAFASQVRHGYYAAISYTDANVGLLLDALEKEGLAENTVIVLWGDHGWKLGDHQEWGKHTNFEVDARVPLIFSAPGQKTAGQKSDSLVEFVDVYPTLADLCGLPAPKVDGVSLKPILENPKATVKPVALSQYPKTVRKEDDKAFSQRAMGYSIRDDRWRLTLWRSLADNTILFTELYDEVNAPKEPENLASKPENKEVIERLSKFLPPPIPAANPNAVKIAKGKKNIIDLDAKKKDEDATAPKLTPPAKAATPDPATDRVAMFERRDVNKDGKLTKEEFMSKQKDPEQAAKNFVKMDKDNSGDLSKEEFVKMGK